MTASTMKHAVAKVVGMVDEGACPGVAIIALMEYRADNVEPSDLCADVTAAAAEVMKIPSSHDHFEALSAIVWIAFHEGRRST